MAQEEDATHKEDEYKSPPLTDKVSPLGKRLRDISNKALTTGTVSLSNEEIHRLISEVRGSA